MSSGAPSALPDAPGALPDAPATLPDAESGTVNTQPFVRLSKAEKKMLKYERAKVSKVMSV
jgi:hypothetical protein